MLLATAATTTYVLLTTISRGRLPFPLPVACNAYAHIWTTRCVECLYYRCTSRWLPLTPARVYALTAPPHRLGFCTLLRILRRHTGGICLTARVYPQQPAVAGADNCTVRDSKTNATGTTIRHIPAGDLLADDNIACSHSHMAVVFSVHQHACDCLARFAPHSPSLTPLLHRLPISRLRSGSCYLGAHLTTYYRAGSGTSVWLGCAVAFEHLCCPL